MKKISAILLLFIMTLVFSVSFNKTNVTSTYADEVSYQEVKSLTIHPASSATGLYLDMPATINNGYGENWSNPITTAQDVVKYNDQTLTAANIPLQYGGNSYRIHIGRGGSDATFKAGDKIVIPEGTTLPVTQDGLNDIKFMYEFTITYDGTSFSLTFKVGVDEFKEYTVDSVEVNINSTDSKAFLQFSDSEGNDCSLGYNAWVNPDTYTKAFAEQVLINGEKFSLDQSHSIQGMDIKNALCLSGYYLNDGGSIVIPEGAIFENSYAKLTFGRTFTFTWSDENRKYTVTRTAKESSFPTYEMEDGMLSDFTRNSVHRLGGQNFIEATINPEVWGINYSGLVKGSFLSAEEAPGTTNGGYEFGWDTTQGLLYPAVMFEFRNDITFNSDDEIVFRIYFDNDMDMSFTLWMTSTKTEKVWEAENIFSGMSLVKGDFNEIHVPVSDYINSEGKIVPICFVFVYEYSYKSTENVPAGRVLFDTATIVKTVKTIDENYEASDISEYIPFNGAKTFTGEASTYTEDFNYEEDFNIGFIRTDKSVDGVKANITITNKNNYSFYFVLNGVSKYYLNGGVYYWINDTTIRVGTASKLYIDEQLPESIKDGEAFILEMMCTPYYVDGLKIGNYVGIKINDVQIGENVYISTASCNFGTYFGFYLHNTTKATSITVAPIVQATESPIKIVLSTSLNATSVKVGESLGTRTKITGKLYNSKDVKYVIVSGSEYAEIDEEGYISGIANGKAIIMATIENDFGTFESNKIELTIGTGEVKKEEKDENPVEEPDEEPQVEKTGCKNSISISLVSGLLVLTSCVVIKKKKENN